MTRTLNHTRPRSASLDSQKLEENTNYIVTHYVPNSAIPNSDINCELRVRLRQLYESTADYDDYNATTTKAAASERMQRMLCAVCADCCADSTEHGPEWRKRTLAADALYLFNAFLEPVEGTAKWQDVQLQLARHERSTVVLVSTCTQHTLELFTFHNMESACLGFVYRGPTDFIEKRSASLGNV